MRQHDRQPLGPLRPHEPLEPVQFDSQDLPVEEHERTERLILRRRRDVSLQGQRGEKGDNFRFPHAARMPLLVKPDEPPDPPHVRFFGPRRVVLRPKRGTHDADQRALAADVRIVLSHGPRPDAIPVPLARTGGRQSTRPAARRICAMRILPVVQKLRLGSDRVPGLELPAIELPDIELPAI